MDPRITFQAHSRLVDELRSKPMTTRSFSALRLVERENRRVFIGQWREQLANARTVCIADDSQLMMQQQQSWPPHPTSWLSTLKFSAPCKVTVAWQRLDGERLHIYNVLLHFRSHETHF